MSKAPPIKPTASTRPAASGPFAHASTKKTTDNARLLVNIRLLLQNLAQYDTKEKANSPGADADIQYKFRQFLIGCEFHMAQADLDNLLEELGTQPRNDGSMAWHHQFSQVLLFLSLIENNTMHPNQLKEYGGLETVIRTALRHDSIEDFGKSFEQFEEEQKDQIEQTFRKLLKQGIQGINAEWRFNQHHNLSILMKNLRLITKKVAILDKDGNPQYHEDGRLKKKNLFESTRDYIHNMVESEDASPIVWILKVCDGTHNLSTMIGAPKFNAQKRLKYANEREDMYGSRQALSEIALNKWPAFKKSIEKIDGLMGSVLYTNFGYLEYVDQEEAYPKDTTKYRDGQTIRALGIGKYLDHATSFSNMPRGLNPLHTLLDKIESIPCDNDFSKYIKIRVINFWEKSLKPALHSHTESFPKIFPPTTRPSNPYVPHA